MFWIFEQNILECSKVSLTFFYIFAFVFPLLIFSSCKNNEQRKKNNKFWIFWSPWTNKTWCAECLPDDPNSILFSSKKYLTKQIWNSFFIPNWNMKIETYCQGRWELYSLKRLSTLRGYNITYNIYIPPRLIKTKGNLGSRFSNIPTLSHLISLKVTQMLN